MMFRAAPLERTRFAPMGQLMLLAALVLSCGGAQEYDPPPAILFQPVRATPATPPPQNVFYAEDFSTVPEGAVPPGWSASDQMVVGGQGRSRSLRLSSASATGNAVIGDISFPADWRLGVIVGIANDCHGDFGIGVGPIRFRTGCCRMAFGSDEVHECRVFGSPVRADRTSALRRSLVTMEKRGTVVTVSVDGRQVFLKRMPELATETIRTVTIDLHQDERDQVQVFELTGTALAPPSSTSGQGPREAFAGGPVAPGDDGTTLPVAPGQARSTFARIEQTFLLDLDEDGQDDLWWEAETENERYLSPRGGAAIGLLPATADPGLEGPAVFENLAMARIAVVNLSPGTTVGFRTSGGAYGFLRVVRYPGRAIEIEYVVWREGGER